MKLRTEFGFGYEEIRINVAYNVPLYNHGMRHVTDFMLSLNYILPFGKTPN
ncbi:hypothetical protein [Flavobacterium sp.]